MHLLAHMVFIAFEIMLYNFMFSMFISEIFYFWLCYQVYMTMNKFALYAYIGILFIAAVVGVFSLLSIGGWFLIYIGQLAGYGFGAYNLVLKMNEWQGEIQLAKATGDLEQ